MGVWIIAAVLVFSAVSLWETSETRPVDGVSCRGTQHLPGEWFLADQDNDLFFFHCYLGFPLRTKCANGKRVPEGYRKSNVNPCTALIKPEGGEGQGSGEEEGSGEGEGSGKIGGSGEEEEGSGEIGGSGEGSGRIGGGGEGSGEEEGSGAEGGGGAGSGGEGGDTSGGSGDEDEISDVIAGFLRD